MYISKIKHEDFGIYVIFLFRTKCGVDIFVGDRAELVSMCHLKQSENVFINIFVFLLLQALVGVCIFCYAKILYMHLHINFTCMYIYEAAAIRVHQL